MEEKIKEKMKEERDNKRPSKFYTVMITLVIGVLLIGFIFMSLILFDILKEVEGISRDFIEFVRDFLDDFEIENSFLF